MHILLIHQAFVSKREAGGTRHFELARHLINNGHQVTVLTSQVNFLTGNQNTVVTKQNFVIKEVIDDIEIWRISTFGALHRNFITRILTFLSFMVAAIIVSPRIKQVDLVMGTSPPLFQGISALTIARLKRIPFLFEIRDLWPDFAVDMGVLRNRFLIAASRWLEKFLYHQADRMMVNSPAYVDHIRSKGVPASDISFIPNGVDVQMFNPQADGATVREKLGLTDQFIVLYAGAHGQANDLTTFLEAAQQVKNEGHSNIVFLLVGDGKEKANLISYSQGLGLNNVRFIDAQPKTEIANFLAAADVCVATLQDIPMFSMVYPNKVFDYMAAGRPVVLAIDGVIREVVEKGQGGIFIPPGNAEALAEGILTLASDPEQCAQMRVNGRKYVEAHFDRIQQAQEFEHMVTSLQSYKKKATAL